MAPGHFSPTPGLTDAGRQAALPACYGDDLSSPSGIGALSFSWARADSDVITS